MRRRLVLAALLVATAVLVVAAASARSPAAWRDLGGGFSVRQTAAAYRTASARPAGWLATGQAADIVLSAAGFNDAGGPLLFNHPGGIASDGRRLLLADRNNNRVLVWNRAPVANVPPDLVLGQRSFRTNEPGTSLGRLDWPVGVAAAAGKVAVADAFNDRILIWTRFPTRSGQAADLAIRNAGGPNADPKRSLVWPWGVWTDGRRLVVSATASAAVLVWNTFPTRNDQPADLVLRGDIGTPRSITSDGRSLIVGDHNPRSGPTVANGQGSWVWKTWPTGDDQPPDYFLADPSDQRGAWLSGTYAAGGKLVLLATKLYVWNGVPASPTQPPELALGQNPAPGSSGRPSYFGGDGSGAAVVGSRLYVSLANSNHILGFRRLPSSEAAKPDFAIGSPDAVTNTLETNYFITNPVPLTDGSRLFVSSDFDRTLSVWTRLPDENGADPDLVYRLPMGAWQSALHEGVLALAGRDSVAVWKQPPLGQGPDLVFQRAIGSVTFQELRGVAIDDRHFYLADKGAGKVYVWDGLPGPGSEPSVTLSVPNVTRLSSDGAHLAVDRTEGKDGSPIWIYDVGTFSPASVPQQVAGRFNLPEQALVAGGSLFVADTPFNRVQIWRNVVDAVAGKPPDTILGARDLSPLPPSIARDRLFWPGALAFDGHYLWVGEFKFSGRLLRYSVR